MELDGSVHQSFLRLMAAFCFREIQFRHQIHLSSKFILLVDECTQYEYNLEDLINRSDESLYKSCVSSTQTEAGLVTTEEHVQPANTAQGQQDQQGEYDEVTVKEEQDCDADDVALDDTEALDDADLESITKVIPTSPSSLNDEPVRKTRREKAACPLCPAKFSEKLLVEKHLKDSHDIGNFYTCNVCQQVCMSNAALIDHTNEHHGVLKNDKKKTRRKKQQPKKVEPKAKSAKKSKQRKNEKKEKTDKKTKKSMKKMKGQEVETPVEEDEVVNDTQESKKIIDEDFVPTDESSQVKCAECGKEYKSKRALRRHFSIVHDMREYQCEICGKNFTGKESLYHHRRGIHLDLKPYKCPEPGCDAMFNFNHSLRLHRLKHTGSRPHQCSVCGKTYLTAYHLKVHTQATHSEQKNFSCKTCGKLFSYSTSLKMHEATHEKALRVNCQQCDKSFVNAQALKYHVMSKHTEPGHFPCDECNKVYKSEFLLRTHKRRHTTDGQRFMCDLCGRQFMYKSALEMHKAVHKDEKTFVCKICDKSFKTYPTLYSHQFVHKEDSPYECAQCGKAFKTKERCKAHAKRHSGLKPFECQICHHCFPDNGGLSKHMRTVHCAVKKFVCNICGKATSRADNLRVHMKVHQKGDYKPKVSKAFKEPNGISPEREYSPLDMPLLVPLTVDEGADTFTVKKAQKAALKADDLFHENNSQDSLASGSSHVPGNDNRFSNTESYHHHNMPHFTTLDSAQISAQSEDQALPLNLQQGHNTSSDNSANFTVSHLDSHGNIPLTASAERHGVPDQHNSSANHSPVPSNPVSVTNLQPAHYMYAWPYMYSSGIQPQPGSSNGFFQQ